MTTSDRIVHPNRSELGPDEPEFVQAVVGLGQHRPDVLQAGSRMALDAIGVREWWHRTSTEPSTSRPIGHGGSSFIKPFGSISTAS